MFRSCHRPNGLEFKPILGDTEGKRSLAWCTVHKVAKSDTT